MDKYNNLGNRIRSRRLALNLSQSDLAKRLNCTQAALSQYENGNREPSLNDLANIAHCLNTTSDYLLCLTDVATNEKSIKEIGDYLGLTEESIEKLHTLFAEHKERTYEENIQEEVKKFSGLNPEDAGYDEDYNFLEIDALLNLNDYIKTLNEFICSQEFSIFISRMKCNLFLERMVYDVFRIVAKQYGDIESPAISNNIAEVAYSCSEGSDEYIEMYSLNLFDAQNALNDFCRNLTQLEAVKKLDYSQSFFRKISYFLYVQTRPMFESGNYSVEKMEEGLSDIVAPLLPTIVDLLSKKV